MSTSRAGKILAEFLVSSKQKYLSSLKSLQKASKNDWAVVMGNESGDLDTIACAIAYAYHQTHHLHKPTIPLIRVHRKDLRLRAENIYALSLAGVNEPDNQLLLLSDIPEGKWSQRDFALVDHNRLAPEFDSEDGDGERARVVAVIDHHEDEGLYKDADPRLISPTGSCASQVAAYILDNAPGHVDGGHPIPPELYTLLLSAILIDTNLKPISNGGKATALDFHAAAILAPHAVYPEEVPDTDVKSMSNPFLELKPKTSLLQLTTSQSPSPSQELDSIVQLLRTSSPLSALSGALSSKKFDVSHLSVSELLRRDYKEYDFAVEIPEEHSDKISVKAGLSTVPVGLTKWAGGNADEEGRLDLLLSESATYMSERGISVLGVLTTFRKEKRKNGTKGKGMREMVWLIRTDLPSPSVADALAQRIFTTFEANEEIAVKRHKKFKQYTKPSHSAQDDTPHARHDNLIVKVYKQGNANATRKATAPVLRRALDCGANA
ncbi:Exopolyphosphatase [Marasmius crinis-equi]|uniref:Exopolyphosphatase n=1 Tax=Marasmius crinis-equi TaxID=585013 RepID=A0ABR3FV87_9AGAR